MQRILNVQILETWNSNRFHNEYIKTQVSRDTNLVMDWHQVSKWFSRSAVEHSATVAYTSGGWRHARCN